MKKEKERMNEPEIYLKMKNLENEKERKEMLLIIMNELRRSS
jgi:hypothetical protein